MHSAALISRSNAKKITSLLVIVAVILLICDRVLFQSHHIKTTTYHTLSWMYNHAAIVLGLHILSMILLTWFFVPPALLVLASGFVFQNIYVVKGWSFVIAWLASILGAVIGGTLAFSRAPGLSRDLLRVVCDRYPILNAVDTAVVKNPLRVMMLLRLNPFLPFGVLNYVFAMKGVDMALFVAAMASVVQWYLFLVCVGAGLSNMYNGYGFIGYAIGAACGALVMVIEWRFAKDELQNEVELYQWGKMATGKDEEMTTCTDGTSIEGGSAPKKESWLKRLGAKLRLTKKTSKEASSSKTQNNAPSEQSATAVEPVNNNIVEDSDLSGTDYVRMQILGENNGSGGGRVSDVYRVTLDAAEIMLDDFS
eukprot:scaffold23237_cov136-Skeletonema_dohrnii-CCMP3373.AAC.1